MMKCRKVEVLIIDRNSVPEDLWSEMTWVADGRYIAHSSELTPMYNRNYEDYLSSSNIENYWKQQCENNDYKDSLDQFIIDYNLRLDKWLIETGYDFSGIKIIFFEK